MDVMAQSVLAQIAELKPRLRAHATWHKHHYRGQAWYLLHDDSVDRQYYLTESAYLLAQQFDGHRSIAQIVETDSDTLPGEKEIVDLVVRLQMADLIVFDRLPADVQKLYSRWSRDNKRGWLGPLLKPLSIKLPLFDPQRLLRLTEPLAKTLFRRSVLIGWCVLIMIALVLGAQYAADLKHHATTRFLNPVNLLILWIIYPLIKGLHEFGHAIAIHYWGGRVREMGVMFLVFVPVPYVQASSASLFESKHQRVIVGAAGIVVELLLAALALIVWTQVQPGFVSDVAFNITVLAGVASLVFNANPLLRFDGYYVMADGLEIPNLATRSRQYFVYLLQRYAYGLADTPSPVMGTGERRWFVFYGITSLVYRMSVSIVIALFVATKLFFVGVILAIWALTSQWVMPLLRGVAYLLTHQDLIGRRLRAVVATTGGLVVAAMTVLLVPLPSATIAEGVVMMPTESIVRAGASGEIMSLLKTTGQVVKRGQPVLQLYDSELTMRARLLRARQRELHTKVQEQLLIDRVTAAIQREQLATINAEIKEVEQLLVALTVRSPTQGYLHLSQARDLTGRFASKGEMLGLVYQKQLLTARVVVPQNEAERVRNDTHRTQARFAGAMQQPIAAQLRTEVPSGSNHLPSASLGTPQGGRVQVDGRDTSGLTALEPVFQFDVSLRNHAEGLIPGRRILVKFSHSPETLASRWYRSLRALFLDRLEV